MMYPRFLIAQKLSTADREGFIVPFIPIGIAASFILIFNVIVISLRVFLPDPGGWEAGIIADAWRMLQGETVYAVGTDHATHMYGPLVTVLLAEAFRFTGPALYVGRLASAISGVAVVAMLARLFGRGGYLGYGVAAALLLAANTRTMIYFTEARPDMDALFFGGLALILFYQGLESATERPRIARVLIGATLLVIAVMFKQTAAMFMFIPALALTGVYGTSFFRKRILAAAIPIIAVLVTFGVTKLFAPGLWHFMIEVPAQYHVSALRSARATVEVLASLPVFLFAFVHWLFTDARNTWQLPRVRWLLAALMCTIPASIIAFTKYGGAENSLIPALLSVSAFCAWRAPVALTLLRDVTRPALLRTVAGFVFGIMLFAHVYPTPEDLWMSKMGLGTETLDLVNERALVIAEARSLPGKVVCPDDPTIPLMAKGYSGRTAVFEEDAVYWDLGRMQALVREISSADYVIVMPKFDWGNVGEFSRKERLLRATGFAKTDFRNSSNRVYQLWLRTLPPEPRSLSAR